MPALKSELDGRNCGAKRTNVIVSVLATRIKSWVRYTLLPFVSNLLSVSKIYTAGSGKG